MIATMATLAALTTIPPLLFCVYLIRRFSMRLNPAGVALTALTLAMLPWLFAHAVMTLASVDAADSPVMLVGALSASCISIIWTMLMFLTKLLVASPRSEFR